MRNLKAAIEFKFAASATEVSNAMGGMFEDVSGYSGSLDRTRFNSVIYQMLPSKRDTQHIPLFGPLGLASQLGVREYSLERKFRERVREWLELVSLCWLECPATVTKNGAFLQLEPAVSVCSQPARGLSQLFCYSDLAP